MTTNLTKETSVGLFDEMIGSELPDGWAITKHCGAKEDRYIVLELPAQGIGEVRTSLSEDDAIGLAWELLKMAHPLSPLVISDLIVNYWSHLGDDNAPTPPPPSS